MYAEPSGSAALLKIRNGKERLNGRTKNGRDYTGDGNNIYRGGESDTDLYREHKRVTSESGGIGAKISGMKQGFPVQGGSFLYA